MLRTLKRYISKRRELTPSVPVAIPLSAEGNGSVQLDISAAEEDTSTDIAPLVAVDETASQPGVSHKPQSLAIVSLSVPAEGTKIPQTTRQMLSHVGYLTEELLRASEEKVNIAQAAYDSVS